MKALDDIVGKLVSPKEVYAVTCRFGSEGLSWSLVHLKLKKGNIELVDSAFSNSLTDLFEERESKPVLLLLLGKKVLTKPVAISGDNDDQVAFEKTFPNVNPEDAFFQVHENRGQQMVSVIRKETLQEVVNKLTSEKLDLIDVAISENAFAGMVEGLSAEVQASIEGGLTESTTISCMGYSIPAQCVPSFLFGINFFSAGIQSEAEEVEEIRREWRYKVLFKQTMTIGSIGLFVLLLINFLAFSHYSGLNEELEVQTSGYDSQIGELQKLKEDREKMKSFLEVNGSDDGQLAMMEDQLAAIVPKEVALSRMSFNPMERHLKRENLYRYSQGVILVEGSTKRYTDFGSWISQVKQFEWVKSVDILGYEESASSHEGQFSIKISIT